MKLLEKLKGNREVNTDWKGLKDDFFNSGKKEQSFEELAMAEGLDESTIKELQAAQKKAERLANSIFSAQGESRKRRPSPIAKVTENEKSQSRESSKKAKEQDIDGIER